LPSGPYLVTATLRGYEEVRVEVLLSPGGRIEGFELRSKKTKQPHDH